MKGIRNLDIEGVTDGPDNDYGAQAAGALQSLRDRDLVFIHVEAPDEAGHAGDIDAKVEAIEKIDREVIQALLSTGYEDLRVLAMPDHPTPIEVRTHVADAVPYVIWGQGFTPNGAKAFNEAEAKGTGAFIKDGYTIAETLIRG